jgi:hypothetical protein
MLDPLGNARSGRIAADVLKLAHMAHLRLPSARFDVDAGSRPAADAQWRAFFPYWRFI